MYATKRVRFGRCDGVSNVGEEPSDVRRQQAALQRDESNRPMYEEEMNRPLYAPTPMYATNRQRGTVQQQRGENRPRYAANSTERNRPHREEPNLRALAGAAHELIRPRRAWPA